MPLGMRLALSGLVAAHDEEVGAAILVGAGVLDLDQRLTGGVAGAFPGADVDALPTMIQLVASPTRRPWRRRDSRWTTPAGGGNR